MTQAEVVAMEVEQPIVKKEKKSKKSKKNVEVEDEVTILKRKAQEEHEDAPKKKKSKKSKTEKTEEVVEEKVEEKVEEAAQAEGEKKKKKKKKSKVAEPAPEESPEEEETKEEEKKEEAVEEKAEEAATEEKAEETNAEAPASLTVFVGGLPWSAEEETVKKDFTECGEITSFRFLTDRETGRPKGSCFIDYANAEGLKKALEFNETDYGGRTIYVRVANDESHKGKGKKGGKKGKGELRLPGEKPEGCKSVIVKNFTYETTEDALWKLFEGCGGIDRLKLLTDRETGESKGIAFIDFSEESACDEAIKKCNTDVDGRLIFVDYSGNNDKGGKKGGKDGKKGKKGDGKKGGKKGGKGKGKKGGKDSAIYSANQGSIVASTGEKKTFDSDSE